jgi:hypothetical protein
MKRTIVRYQVKPEHVDRNTELVRAVYEELHRSAPEGIRYATYLLEDGVTFVHTAVQEGEASVTDLEAFGRFQEGLRDRCQVPPEAQGATEVGSYRLPGE